MVTALVKKNFVTLKNKIVTDRCVYSLEGDTSHLTYQVPETFTCVKLMFNVTNAN